VAFLAGVVNLPGVDLGYQSRQLASAHLAGAPALAENHFMQPERRLMPRFSVLLLRK